MTDSGKSGNKPADSGPIVAHYGHTGPDAVSDLYAIARDVRRIGNGFRDNPETIAAGKEALADRIVDIARRLA
jgi:hypothetical protein